MTAVLRYSAFTTTPTGGNPAGVVLDASALGDDEMQAVAAEVGYSETAFLVPSGGSRFGIRYFSPAAEVPFCGHATIATGVVLGEREGAGTYLLQTRSGEVEVEAGADSEGAFATLTSVVPRVFDIGDTDLDEALAALRWSRPDLDPGMPPRVAFAGANHLVLPVRKRDRLADLDYDFSALRDLMLRRDWTTLQLVWRESDAIHHARDPFPVGGVVEDPATGAAAAAYGAYLKELDLVSAPFRFLIRQGEDMGRPSRLLVELVEGDSRVRVSGHAVPIDR